MARISIYLTLLLVASSALANSDVPLIDDTPAAACEVLKRHMAVVMDLPHHQPDQHWFCDHSTEQNEYLYIIGLRYNPSGPSPTVPLIGWFAVARKSSVVLQLDVAEGRLTPISPSYYKAAPRSHKARPR